MDVDKNSTTIDTQAKTSTKVAAFVIFVTLGIAVTGGGLAALGVISYPGDIKGKNLTQLWNAISVLDNNQQEQDTSISNLKILHATTNPICGNGNVEAGEECDNPWNNGEISPIGTSCKQVQPDGDGTRTEGTLKCTDECKLDYSACEIIILPPEPICGDGIVQSPEQCDPDPWNDGIIGTSCEQIQPDASGILKCNSDCQFDYSECTVSF